MSEAGRTAAARRAIENELEDLRFHWGEAYEVRHDDEHGWLAQRIDGQGGWLNTATTDELYKAITDDYTARPVSRDRS